jgi:hypothetical protein
MTAQGIALDADTSPPSDWKIWIVAEQGDRISEKVSQVSTRLDDLVVISIDTAIGKNEFKLVQFGLDRSALAD